MTNATLSKAIRSSSKAKRRGRTGPFHCTTTLRCGHLSRPCGQRRRITPRPKGAPRRLQIGCTGGRLPWRDRQCGRAGLYRIADGRAELQTRKDRGPCADEASRHASRSCIPGRIPGLREGRLYLRPSDRSQWRDGVNAHSHSGGNVLAGYWVVIPAYNEAATIRDVASRAIQADQARDRRGRWVDRWHGRSPDRVARGHCCESHEPREGRQPVAWLSAGIGCRSLRRRDAGRRWPACAGRHSKIARCSCFLP